MKNYNKKSRLPYVNNSKTRQVQTVDIPLVFIGLVQFACLAVFTLLFVLVLSWITKNNQAQYDYSETTYYCVEKGDTLWSVAQEYSDERHDTREVVSDIQELSNCTSLIQVGQNLVIPLYDCMKN